MAAKVGGGPHFGLGPGLLGESGAAWVLDELLAGGGRRGGGRRGGSRGIGRRLLGERDGEASRGLGSLLLDRSARRNRQGGVGSSSGRGADTVLGGILLGAGSLLDELQHAAGGGNDGGLGPRLLGESGAWVLDVFLAGGRRRGGTSRGLGSRLLGERWGSTSWSRFSAPRRATSLSTSQLPRGCGIERLARIHPLSEPHMATDTHSAQL